MNKAELVSRIAEVTGFTKRDAERFVDAFVDVVTEALASGEEVRLVGFGKFYVRKRAERKGVNPKTKEKIRIPAKYVPKFKPGKKLAEAVAKKR
jgi:DNA-binding protein HU-beta